MQKLIPLDSRRRKSFRIPPPGPSALALTTPCA